MNPRTRLLLGLLALVVLCAGTAFVLASPHIDSVATTVDGPADTPSPTPTPTPTAEPPTASPVPCIQPGAVSQPYTNDPGKTGPKAFGPPADLNPDVSAVLVELRLRLCGRPGHGPDERLWAAIDAAVNGTDPNLQVPNSAWVQRVNPLVSYDIQWRTARIVTRDFGPGSRTLDMTPGVFPAVGATAPTDGPSEYLVVEVATQDPGDGPTVTLYLRLACGFQPYFESVERMPESLRQLL